MGAVPVQDAIDDLAPRAFHWRLLALVGAIILLDGFDIQLAAFAGPAILADWKLGSAALAPVMAASLAGMAFGTSIGGRIGDRFGRRPALIGAVVWFGATAMLTALCRDVTSLTALRFITGLGLGAAVPNATALIAEWMPARARNYAVTVISVGVPCGGIIGAAIASWLIPAYGWPAAFLLGGALPLLLSLVMLRALPESPILLAQRGAPAPRIASLIARAGGTATGPFLPPPVVAESGRVFGPALRRSTIGMGIAFFASLMAVYALLSWVPVLLSKAGFPMDAAIRGSMILNLAGVATSFLLTWIVLRVGSRVTIVATAIAGMAALAFWAMLLHTPGTSPLAILAGVALTGATVLSLQVMLLALSAHVFPVECRSAGIGYSISIGRLGAILSAFGAGVLLGLPQGTLLFFAMIGTALVALAGGVMLVDRHMPPRHAPPAPNKELAPNDA
ncbi:MFS transporter, AAHS family, 4-hydroxybenzoate transporter [Sphingomonas laterariae]|uniref:MFS transporter, AAHS family, 4-hydroxybenzoate transporter n=1 Tax=Edaphosphingomonas laterariae TaxID=861865 RepID=A0A239CVC9_9SPHN|nr:MFS transporter [Sphingomonas laterariae]SNS24060.1 MFS transporter, AAHS family, 4-hydroxybenzoate transporter [Sphingomonas laterariae]